MDVPKTCSLVAFWDDEASQTLPILIARNGDFQAVADSLVAESASCILLGDCRGAEDLQKCDMALSVAEAKAGRAEGATLIVASVDSAAALMQIGTLGGRSARLAGLTWNRTAFCNNIGCTPESPVAGLARAQIVIAARACGVPAYDSSELHEDAASLGFDGICRVE